MNKLFIVLFFLAFYFNIINCKPEKGFKFCENFNSMRDKVCKFGNEQQPCLKPSFKGNKNYYYNDDILKLKSYVNLTLLH